MNLERWDTQLCAGRPILLWDSRELECQPPE